MEDAMPDGGFANDRMPLNHGIVEGTAILTARGAVAVESVRAGDRVVTRAGAMRVVAVERRVERMARLVKVSASALGHDRPEDDMWIAADQPVLVRDWRARALTGADRAMIPAVRLCDGEYIRAEVRRDAAIWTLHFDAPAVVYAGGLELGCEVVAVPA
jgi:hypothetical protein